MNNPTKHTFNFKKLLFHAILIFIVFLFFSFDKDHPLIEAHEIVFFLNYLMASIIINYVLFPKFMYKKKYGLFIFYFCMLMAVVIVFEESVIERIYFPDTKGKRFSNVIYTLIDVFPPIAILSGFKLALDAIAKQRQLDELKVMVKESELQFLKSQINPHFLFNNMNNLYAHAIEKSPKTPEIILALSSILRYMLYECKSKYVSLEKETEQLKNFIRLSEMQIEGRGHISFSHETATSGFQIAPLILMVFVENAVKHSASSLTEAIDIHIDLRLEKNGKLHFTCKNSFQTLSNTESLSKGIGLNNVKKRLSLLYPDSHELNISSHADFYEVSLTLDLNKLI